jgi:late competence protein required for DNA uptake (superfamily II DNA/RNA helicase)
MQDILKKSQSLVEKTKLQASIASKNVKMSSLYEELGRLVYKMDCECIAKNEEAASLLVEIQALELEVNALKDQIQALANKVKCESCGEYHDKVKGHYDEETDAWYCNDCYTNLLEERKEEEESEGVDNEEQAS